MIMFIGFIATTGVSAAEPTNSTNQNLTLSDKVGLDHSLNKTAISSITAPTDQEIKKQVSDFLAKTIPILKQQRTETIQAINDCRDKIKNATPEDVANINAQCNAIFKDIKEKYAQSRADLNKLFKEYRNIVNTMMRDQISQIHAIDKVSKTTPPAKTTKTTPPAKTTKTTPPAKTTKTTPPAKTKTPGFAFS